MLHVISYESHSSSSKHRNIEQFWSETGRRKWEWLIDMCTEVKTMKGSPPPTPFLSLQYLFNFHPKAAGT